MWEQLLMVAVFAATLGVAVLVNARLRKQVAEANAALDGRDREIRELKASHQRALEVKAAEMDSLRQELDAENERLDRENYRLHIDAEAREKYDVCHRCNQPKGQAQSGNGQRARGNGRVHAIVNGDD